MRERLEGLVPFLGVAAVLFVVGVLAVLLEVQSPSWRLWSGVEVHGATQNGIVFYTYRGQHYTADNPGASGSDSRRVPTTVWLDRGDPTDQNKAYVENAYDRWLDFGFVVGWFALAALVLLIGVLRRTLRRRRRIETMGEFGAGISDEVVRRLLAERRRGVSRDG